MTRIERDGERFVVPAALLAETFCLTADMVRQHMLDGLITTRSEVGVDKDEGRWRLTFFYKDRACRLIIDENGTIRKRVRFPVTPRTAPSIQGK